MAKDQGYQAEENRAEPHQNAGEAAVTAAADASMGNVPDPSEHGSEGRPAGKGGRRRKTAAKKDDEDEPERRHGQDAGRNRETDMDLTPTQASNGSTRGGEWNDAPHPGGRVSTG